MTELLLRRVTARSHLYLQGRIRDGERVHAFRSDADFLDRLGTDRRCYVLVDPRQMEEPHIVVWVALTRGLASSIREILDPEAPLTTDADTATLYSISNIRLEAGRGPLGNEMITRVMTVLQRDIPGLERVATLSPIPGFRAWMESRSERDHMGAMARQYLIEGGAKVKDPVAHFHLSNGARIERINLGADLSEKGVREGCGVMVNYLYDPAEMKNRSLGYLTQGTRAVAPDLWP